MTRVAELIDLIVQGKNTEASEVMNSELLSRSYEAINGIKPQVAADYFAPVVDFGGDVDQVEVGSPEEPQAPEVTNETD